MPLTLAHPALVLPLRRFAPRWLDFSALVAGSMAPDALYYFGAKQGALAAHTPVTGLWLSAPSALLLLILIYAARTPLARLLPQPLRTPCLAACRHMAPIDARRAISVAASLLLGIWSHILWDSFTHPWGWFARNWSVLHTHYASLGSYDVYGFKLAQHGSTLAGLSAIALCSLRWARRNAAQTALEWDRTRALAWIVSTAGALLAGALSTVVNYPSHAGMLFYFITSGTVAFFVLAIAAGLLLRRQLSS